MARTLAPEEVLQNILYIESDEIDDDSERDSEVEFEDSLVYQAKTTVKTRKLKRTMGQQEIKWLDEMEHDGPFCQRTKEGVIIEQRNIFPEKIGPTRGCDGIETI